MRRNDSMPLYEYFCKNCGKRFDKMLRFSEANKVPECPYCSSKETSKQISTFAAVGVSSGSGAQAQSASSCSNGGRFH
jgi:putative FmdB family regulatory protein